MGKLIKAYKGSNTALVADVDCTAAGKELCETHGVEGFPTIKWGDPSSLESYEGGREYDDLKKFVKENLKPMCSPSNIDLCSEEKKKEISDLQALPAEELAAKIEEKKKEQKDASEHFDAEVKKLQDRYQQLETEKKEKIAAVKASGLGLMQAVQAAAKKAGGKEEL